MNELTTAFLREEYPEAYALYVDAKEKTRNTTRQRGLDNLWKVLANQHAKKSTDFKVATIGAQTEALGGPTAQTIRNQNGADYRAIIVAFAKKAGGITKGKIAKPNTEFENAVAKIEDRATRHMVKLILQENKSLRNENNILKHTITNEVPPLRPAPTQQPQLPSSPLLAPYQVEAIKEFIEPAEMRAKGWALNEYGAIMDAQNNEVAPVGLHEALVSIVESLPTC